MTDGISRFKQMLSRGQKPRRHNWRQNWVQPYGQRCISHNDTESGLFDSLLPEQQMSTDTEVKIAFDKRIDQVGLVNELSKQYADVLKDDLKAALAKKNADRAEGEFFDAIMVQSETRSIDPDAIVDLFVKRKIDRAQLVSVLTVNAGKCEEFLSREVVDGLSTKKPSTSLRITRKKGVALALLDCLHGLAEAIRPKAKAA